MWAYSYFAVEQSRNEAILTNRALAYISMKK